MIRNLKLHWKLLSCFFGLSLLAYAPAIVAVWQGGMPFRASSDAMSLFGAWRHFANQSLSQGLLPLWNPHTFCGMPFLSNLQTSFWYPPNVVYWLFDFRVALLLDAIFHHVVLLTGAYVFARALRMGRSSALFVALAWGLSGSVAAHAYVGHTTWNAARAFMPWLLWATLLYLRSGRQRDIAIWCALLVAQVAAGYPPMSMLSLALCAGLWLARTVSYARRPAQNAQNTTSSTRKASWLGEIGQRFQVAWPYLTVALLLMSVMALPFVELNRASTHGTALPYEEASRLSGSWRSLARLLLPFYFGDNHFQWSVKLTGAYEQLGYVGLYATALAICAPLLWLRIGRRADALNHSASLNTAWRALPWLCGLLPISILLSLGSEIPLHRWLYDHTALFKQLRIPGRWIELWVVAVPLIAGFCNQHLVLPRVARSMDDSLPKKTAAQQEKPNGFVFDGVKMLNYVIWALFIFTGAALIITVWTPLDVWMERLRLGAYGIKMSSRDSLQAIDGFKNMALSSCINALLLCALLLLALQALRPTKNLRLVTPRRAYCGLLAILAFDLLNLFISSASTTSSSAYAKLFLPKTVEAQGRFPERWATMGFWAESNVHLPSNIDALNGYDAMMGKDFYTFSAKIDSQRIAHYNDWFYLRRDSALFKVAGVTQSLWREGARRDPQAPNLILPAQHFGDWYLARQRGTWPRFYLSRHMILTPRARQLDVLQKLAQRDFEAQNRPIVVEDNLNVTYTPLSGEDRVLDVARTLNTMTFHVNATAPSVLATAEAAYPGWRVWVNGQPTALHHVNYLFRGVTVPAGRSDVSMVYEPQTYRFALFITLLAAGALSAITGAFFSRRQKRSA